MYPRYSDLSKRELNRRVERLFEILENCQICPRRCQINRLKDKKGFCKVGYLPMVSAHHPHFGEESPLVGTHGSGTIFFTSCNLACVYCQNYEISQLRIGEEISFERLAGMMMELQKMGCHNINLVSPTSHVPAIVKALPIAREQDLKLPLIYNTNAYDSVEVLKLLDGIVDIYMPDVKYSDNKIALKYSNAPRYYEIMKDAIKEMYRQVGDLMINEEGIAVKGLLVRHLVLPNNLAGTEKIVEFLAKEISQNTFLNVMDQYYPYFKVYPPKFCGTKFRRTSQFPELSRRITDEEYLRAINLAKNAGLKRLYKE